MEYEWASLRRHTDQWTQKSSYLFLIRCHPTKWARKLKGHTTRFKTYLGDYNNWVKYPGLEALGEKDPSLEEINKMFLIAKQNYTAKELDENSA